MRENRIHNLPYEKVGKNEPVCIADEVPFNIPNSWEFVRLKEICQLLDGEKKSDESHIVMDAKFLRGKNEGTISECGKFIHANDLMILVDGENSGEVFTAPIDGYMGSTFKQLWISPKMHFEYVLLFIELYRLPLKNSKVGAAIPHLNKQLFFNLLLPVPSFEEQQRIVEKYLKVSISVDEYSKYEKKLSTINSVFPEQLRKSILQEAVQGKLVLQDPNDEPASVLLERIREEKERLVKEGKIKKDKHESVIFRRDNSHYEKLDGNERCIDDEIPFDIPENWVWTRFGQVISLLSGTDFKPEEYNDTQKGTPYITGASSLSENGVLLNRWTEMPRVIANRGDVLLVCKGSGYGKTVICDIEEAHIARQIMAIKKFITLDMHYVRLFLQANFDKIKSRGQGVIPGIDRNSVMNLLFPIPPLSEQRRIVEKQQELFDKITLI